METNGLDRAMRKRLTRLGGLCLLALAAAPVAANAQPGGGSAAVAGGYDVSRTSIGTLLDDPAARAVIDAALPGFSASPQVDMARAMTLASIQQFNPEQITDAKLASIQAALARLPAK
jgi:hypothetical protein